MTRAVIPDVGQWIVRQLAGIEAQRQANTAQALAELHTNIVRMRRRANTLGDKQKGTLCRKFEKKLR